MNASHKSSDHKSKNKNKTTTQKQTNEQTNKKQHTISPSVNGLINFHCIYHHRISSGKYSYYFEFGQIQTPWLPHFARRKWKKKRKKKDHDNTYWPKKEEDNIYYLKARVMFGQLVVSFPAVSSGQLSYKTFRQKKNQPLWNNHSRDLEAVISLTKGRRAWTRLANRMCTAKKWTQSWDKDGYLNIWWLGR